MKLPYQLHMMMMTADKSRDETSPVDEVVRVWLTAIDSFGMHCILVFDKYYFSTGSVEVLTEREEGANEPSTFFLYRVGTCLYYEDSYGSFRR